MIKLDEEALICDLAETYQIYDYKQLPFQMVAVFSCGLRENSRIKMKMQGQDVPMDTLLLAGISDRLSLLLWTKTKDGQSNKNKPTSILESMLPSEKKKNDTCVFNCGEDFEKARRKLLEGEG